MTMPAHDAAPGVAAQPAAAVLDARALGVTYRTKRGSIEALRDLNLSVAAGEFVAILGPSGCGKSTLLKVAAGLMQPSTGSLTLHGTPVDRPRPDVGVVFQKANLLPWKTVLGNAVIAADALGHDKTASRARARQLLESVGLTGFVDNYPQELSGGMQQRVGLVRALVHDPGVLFMDEPFAALDAMTREHMTLELQRLWLRTGKSVVFITHSIPEAVFLADRVVVLSGRPGQVVEDMAIDIPRPRDLDTMSDARFARYCAHLRGHFRSVLVGG